MVRDVTVEKSIGRYIVEIVDKTRNDPDLKLGVSQRGSLMLFRATQAADFLTGRDFALPDDVQGIVPRQPARNRKAAPSPS